METWKLRLERYRISAICASMNHPKNSHAITAKELQELARKDTQLAKALTPLKPMSFVVHGMQDSLVRYVERNATLAGSTGVRKVSNWFVEIAMNPP